MNETAKNNTPKHLHEISYSQQIPRSPSTDATGVLIKSILTAMIPENIAPTTSCQQVQGPVRKEA